MKKFILFILGIFQLFACTIMEEKITPSVSKAEDNTIKQESPALLGTFLTQKGPQSKWDDNTLREAFQRAKEAGIGVAIWTNDWGTIEPSLGNYNWELLDYVTAVTKQNGLKFSLSLEIAHITDKANYPSEILFTRFDDSVFLNSFKTFIRQFLKRYTGKIDYLFIGQEVD